MKMRWSEIEAPTTHQLPIKIIFFVQQATLLKFSLPYRAASLLNYYGRYTTYTDRLFIIA